MLHTFSLQQTPFLEQGWNDEDIMKKMDNHASYETPQSEVVKMKTNYILCQSPGSGGSENPGGGTGF